jgi:hypothetical protein
MRLGTFWRWCEWDCVELLRVQDSYAELLIDLRAEDGSRDAQHQFAVITEVTTTEVLSE